MELSRPWQIARDLVACFITAIFFFPIFWWALASFKPIAAMFDKDRVVWFDFEPHLNNYKVTLMGVSRTQSTVDSGITMGAAGADSYDARQSLLDSAIVSIGATGVTIFCAVIAAYALSRMTFSGRGAYLNWVLGMRFMPPIAIMARRPCCSSRIFMRSSLAGDMRPIGSQPKSPG